MRSDFDRIVDYFGANHVLSLATCRDGAPWAANCFYAFDETAMTLLVLSEAATRHAEEMAHNSRIAGTVSSQEANVARLRGLQFEGHARRLAGDAAKIGRAVYVARFPIARLASAPLWAVELDRIKLTDNTLGFGRKINWQRPLSRDP